MYLYYIFVLNDIEIGDNLIKAEEILDILLKNQVWAFSQNPPNIKKFKQDDRIIAYLAGKRRRYFVANFSIGSEIKSNNISINEPWCSLFPLSCSIKDICIWNESLPIQGIIRDLNFIKDKKNWGLFFRQSNKLINKEDFNLILRKADKKGEKK